MVLFCIKLQGVILSQGSKTAGGVLVSLLFCISCRLQLRDSVPFLSLSVIHLTHWGPWGPPPPGSMTKAFDAINAFALLLQRISLSFHLQEIPPIALHWYSTLLMSGSPGNLPASPTHTKETRLCSQQMDDDELSKIMLIVDNRVPAPNRWHPSLYSSHSD